LAEFFRGTSKKAKDTCNGRQGKPFPKTGRAKEKPLTEFGEGQKGTGGQFTSKKEKSPGYGLGVEKSGGQKRMKVVKRLVDQNWKKFLKICIGFFPRN